MDTTPTGSEGVTEITDECRMNWSTIPTFDELMTKALTRSQ
jgi:hypothetical protein